MDQIYHPYGEFRTIIVALIRTLLLNEIVSGNNIDLHSVQTSRGMMMLNYKAAVLGSLGCFISGLVGTNVAYAQTVNCEAALQFDTTVIEQNYLGRLAILNVVNSSNFEEAQKNYGAKIPGYFDGNFSEFSQKRAEFSQTLNVDQSIKSDSTYVQRVLSPAGAKAFADCLARTSGDPFVAWISSGQRSTSVAVSIRNGRAGNGGVKVTFDLPDYIKSFSSPFELSNGSTKTIIFQAPLDKPFLVILNAEDATTTAAYTVPPLEMAPYVQMVSKKEYATVRGVAVCGAGGHGSTAGNYAPTDVYLTAANGYRLLPDTLTITGRSVIGGPGLSRDPVFVWDKRPADTSFPTTMVGHPTQCEGNSGHTQGHTAYDFEVNSFREVVTKVQ